MYTNEEIVRDCLILFRDTEGNRVDVPGIGETVLFDEPIFGFASAEDELFETFRLPPACSEDEEEVFAALRLRKVPGRSSVRIPLTGQKVRWTETNLENWLILSL